MEAVSDRSLEEARDAFKAFDREGRGCIAQADFTRLLQTKQMVKVCGDGLSAPEWLREIDPNGSGQPVQLPDFIMLVSRKILRAADPELQKAFKAFESAGAEHHTVSSVAMLHVLSSMGSELDRVAKPAAASLLHCTPDADARVHYKHVLKEESSRADPMPLMEKVFAEEGDDDD